MGKTLVILVSTLKYSQPPNFTDMETEAKAKKSEMTCPMLHDFIMLKMGL